MYSEYCNLWLILKVSMRYFPLFHTKSLKSAMYFTLLLVKWVWLLATQKSAFKTSVIRKESCVQPNAVKKIPGVTGKFGLGVQNEAGQRLIEFCQENALVIANTLFQQHKRRLYTWTSPDGQYQNQTDYILCYILCSQRRRGSIQSAKTRPGADCGSDHELFIAKCRLKLKKVEETTRPFRCNLNKIPYDYTVEVTNRFKELDLIFRISEELQAEVPDIVQQVMIKAITKEMKCQKAKWLSEEALKIAERRKTKGKGEKESYTHLNAEFQRIARRVK